MNHHQRWHAQSTLNFKMLPCLTIHLYFEIVNAQQDYYGRWRGTLLHSYCTGTYTEVAMLLLWGNSAVTMEYPHSYSVGVPAWVLQGSIGATLKKQHSYFSVGTCSNCIIGYHIAGYINLAVWVLVGWLVDWLVRSRHDWQLVTSTMTHHLWQSLARE